MQFVIQKWSAIAAALRPTVHSPWFWLGAGGIIALILALAALLLALAAHQRGGRELRPYLSITDWGAELPLPAAVESQPIRLRLRLTNAGVVAAALSDSRCRLLLDGKLAGEGLPPAGAALLFPKADFVWLIELTAAHYPIGSVVVGTVLLGVELSLNYRAAGARRGKPFHTTIRAELRPGFGWVTVEATAD